MPLRLSSISFSIRLFVITAVMAAAMLVLLAFELIQRQVLLEQNAVRVDSLKEARESAAAAGVNAFIPKPVQLQELQNALNTHVKSATQEDEAALN